MPPGAALGGGTSNRVVGPVADCFNHTGRGGTTQLTLERLGFWLGCGELDSVLPRAIGWEVAMEGPPHTPSLVDDNDKYAL